MTEISNERGVKVDAATRGRMAKAAKVAWLNCQLDPKDPECWLIAVDAVLALMPKAVPAVVTDEMARRGLEGRRKFVPVPLPVTEQSERWEYRGVPAGTFEEAKAAQQSEVVRNILEAALAVASRDGAAPAPDQRLAAVAAWWDSMSHWDRDDAGVALHSLLIDLLTRVAALERGR